MYAIDSTCARRRSAEIAEDDGREDEYWSVDGNWTDAAGPDAGEGVAAGIGSYAAVAPTDADAGLDTDEMDIVAT